MINKQIKKEVYAGMLVINDRISTQVRSNRSCMSKTYNNSGIGFRFEPSIYKLRMSETYLLSSFDY